MHVKYVLATPPHLIIVSFFEYFENVANKLTKMLLGYNYRFEIGGIKFALTTLTVQHRSFPHLFYFLSYYESVEFEGIENLSLQH